MKLLRFITLPEAISAFERRYLARVNRLALVLVAAHVPAYTLLAWSNGTSASSAFGATAGTLVVLTLASRTLANPRHVSVAISVGAMLLAGMLVHFAQGPARVEMHLYAFVLLAVIPAFANPVAVAAAVGTMGTIQVALWSASTRGVVAHGVPWWGVSLHVLFAALEAAAACFVARTFFDHVIGFERVVGERTCELAGKNAELRLLLDNVSQGFATIDARGELTPVRSAAFDRWFDAPSAGASWFERLEGLSPEFALSSRVGWEEVVGGVMPQELTLEQMPRALVVDGRHLQVEYRPLGAGEPAARYLVVVTDVTVAVERERAVSRRTEALTIFERVLADRAGVSAFLEEAGAIVEALRKPGHRLAATQRALHTLKGNASLFGLVGIASLCHELEDHIAATGEAPGAALIERLAEDWARVTQDIERMMGRRNVIELEERQYVELVDAVRRSPDGKTALAHLRGLRLEPTRRRLEHFAEQASLIAARVGKPGLTAAVEDHGVRLDARRWRGFWSALVHAVRNAIDHGIEAPAEREAKGKPRGGRLWLRTALEAERLVIEVQDDGRGIDWGRVREQAANMGLDVSTPEALQSAIFEDRMSTTPEVSDLSGRGVGMGALLDATRAIGGEVTIRSTPGAGTTVRMTFPLSASRTLESIPPAARQVKDIFPGAQPTLRILQRRRS